MSNIQSVSWSNKDIVKSLQEIAQRGDAAYVLTTSSALEELLENALEGKMRTLSNALRNRLFEGYGPLATFSAKIDVADAFKIIADEVVSDFRAIKDIRNRFAHTTVPLHFQSPELASRFQVLSGWTKEKPSKELFDERVAACMAALKPHIEAAKFAAALEGRSSAQNSSPETS
jgi:hypothetical protein